MRGLGLRRRPSLCLAAAVTGLLALPAGAAMEVVPRAFFVDSSICTVLARAPIDTTKPLQAGTPLDLLVSMPTICTSNVSGQTAVQGGVRSLLAAGFRITAVSHQVTPLSSTPGDPRVELLITAVFGLERPQSQLALPGNTR